MSASRLQVKTRLLLAFRVSPPECCRSWSRTAGKRLW